MSRLTVVSLAAIAISSGHTLLIAWLTRRLLIRTGARLTSWMVLLLVQPVLRLGLATLAVLAFWEGGIVAGFGVVAGFWLGRTIILFAAHRLDAG